MMIPHTLQALMKTHGRRQAELADHLGVSEPSVSRWARRDADIPSKYIQPIADFLGVPVADVVAVTVAIPAPENAA